MSRLNVVAVAYAVVADVVQCCSLMLKELWTVPEQNLIYELRGARKYRV
jgi:hypothetical protein